MGGYKMTESVRTILSKEVLLPAGLVMALVVPTIAGVISATWWISNRLHETDLAIEEGVRNSNANVEVLKGEFEKFNSKLSALVADNYSKTEASEVASRNALMNPNIVVADPRNPNRVLPNEAGRRYIRGDQSSTDEMN